MSFEVAPGVLTGLLGPNGAGKTTLLRIMLGVLSPDRGEVRYGDRPVVEDDRRQWGYLPQERGLYPGMTAGDQVTHFGRLHGLSRQDARSRGHVLLAELGLDERWSDRTDKLSGGMQQRLQLATAPPNHDWLLAYPGVTVVSDEAGELRLAIPPGTEPLDILDGARAAGQVVDFGLDLPTLSQLFLAAADQTSDRAGVL